MYPCKSLSKDFIYIKAFGTITLVSPLAKPNQKQASLGALSAFLRVSLQSIEPGRNRQRSSTEQENYKPSIPTPLISK